MMSLRRRSLTLVVALLLTGCGHDRADRAYLAALRGDETDLTRVEQLALIDQAIAIEPARVRYWETRAILHIDEREFATALSDLDRATVLAPRPYLYFLRGLVHCQSDDCAGGIDDFDRAIAGQPENSQFYRGRALARVELGRFDAALADADHLVSLAPQMAASHYARGLALTRLGRCDEALAELGVAASIRPELVYVMRARVECHQQLGNTEQATRDRVRAEELMTQHARCAACVDPFRY